MTSPEQPTLQEMEEHLRINMADLDTALIRQPELFRQVSDGYALAVSYRDQAKEELEQTDSRLYTELKEEAEEQGKKATEASIKAEIRQHPEHQKAHDEWLQKKLEADQWSSLKDSFNQRSHMLRDLVSLFVSGFFSDPSAIPQGEENVSGSSNQEKLDEHRRNLEKKARKEKA